MGEGRKSSNKQQNGIEKRRKHTHPREQPRSTFPMSVHAHTHTPLLRWSAEFTKRMHHPRHTPRHARARADLISWAGTQRKRRAEYAQDGPLGKRSAGATPPLFRVACMCVFGFVVLASIFPRFELVSSAGARHPQRLYLSPARTHAQQGMNRLPTHAPSQLLFHEEGLNRKSENTHTHKIKRSKVRGRVGKREGDGERKGKELAVTEGRKEHSTPAQTIRTSTQINK